MTILFSCRDLMKTGLKFFKGPNKLLKHRVFLVQMEMLLFIFERMRNFYVYKSAIFVFKYYTPKIN